MCNQWSIWSVFSLDRWTGIVMYSEGSCFRLGLIVDEIEVSCLTVAFSLGGAGAVSK
jgi:hypothetical protein